jgi:hypothetical protein
MDAVRPGARHAGPAPRLTRLRRRTLGRSLGTRRASGRLAAGNEPPEAETAGEQQHHGGGRGSGPPQPGQVAALGGRDRLGVGELRLRGGLVDRWLLDVRLDHGRRVNVGLEQLVGDLEALAAK